jgi:hypothetical protein
MSQPNISSLNTKKRVEISFEENTVRENGDLLIIKGDSSSVNK